MGKLFQMTDVVIPISLTPRKISPREEWENNRSVSFYLEKKETHSEIVLKEFYVVDQSDCIGVGAHGAIYCGRDKRTTEYVCIKTTLKEERGPFMEQVILRMIPKNPNIVKYLDFITSSEYSFLILEYVDGMDLLDKLNRDATAGLKPFTEENSRKMFAQLMNGIQHLHHHGIVHRDVKMENIMIENKTDRVVLVDFGYAGIWFEQRKFTTFCGSMGYTSPEIIKHDSYQGPEIDIWGCAVVLYCATVGTMPFGGITDNDVAASILRGRYIVPPNLTHSFRQLLSGMFEKDPTKRLKADAILAHPWITNKIVTGDRYQLQHSSVRKMGKSNTEEAITKNDDVITPKMHRGSTFANLKRKLTKQ